MRRWLERPLQMPSCGYYNIKRYAVLVVVSAYLVAVSFMASALAGRYPQNSSDWPALLHRDKSSMPDSPVLQESGTRLDQHRVESADEPEIWARGPAPPSSTTALREAIGADVTQQLHALCGRCLYRTLTSYVRVHDHGRFTIVLTGDIPAMWLRDSAVQMASYLPRVARRPALRQTIEGAIRAQAYFVLQVGWNNGP